VKQFWIFDFGFSIARSKAKKILCLALTALLFALGFSAEAQQSGKIPRIGFLSASGESNTPGPQVEAFRQGLRDLGYVEGKNIVVEYRYLEGRLDRVPGLVAELVQPKPDVIIVTSLPGIRAAKETTKTIPIVFVTAQDPVATGIVDSLARRVEISQGSQYSPES
jgi:putative ABC transport system substrate-binding protein